MNPLITKLKLDYKIKQSNIPLGEWKPYSEDERMECVLARHYTDDINVVELLSSLNLIQDQNTVGSTYYFSILYVRLLNSLEDYNYA